MKLSKQQKITKQKLEALNSPGALMMLVNVLRENYDIYGDPENPLMINHIVNRIANIVARLKVQYLNNITPLVDTKQLSIEDENVGIYLPDGSHALFNGEPTKETVDAVQDMIKLAKKNVK